MDTSNTNNDYRTIDPLIIPFYARPILSILNDLFDKYRVKKVIYIKGLFKNGKILCGINKYLQPIVRVEIGPSIITYPFDSAAYIYEMINPFKGDWYFYVPVNPDNYLDLGVWHSISEFKVWKELQHDETQNSN